MTSLQITEAQMTALETAGVFECPEGDEVMLAAAIKGSRILFSQDNADQLARIVNDLSNAADEVSRDVTGDLAKWMRKDARVLANLYGRILRA